MSQAKTVASDLAGTGRELLGNNKKTAWLVGISFAVANWLGWISVGIPPWWPIGAVALGAAYFIGKEAAKRIDELLPEEQGIKLICYGQEAEYELSEDQFADMTTDGTLYAWDESPRRVYECVRYDPEENHAVANWKESFPGSEVGAQKTPADAIAIVEEFRQNFEPELADARELKRRIRGVLREMDKERAQAQDAMIDDHVAPDLGDSRSVSEVLREVVPEDMHPYGSAGDDEDGETVAEDPEIDLDVEENGQPAAATDGGQTDG